LILQRIQNLLKYSTASGIEIYKLRKQARVVFLPTLWVSAESVLSSMRIAPLEAWMTSILSWMGSKFVGDPKKENPFKFSLNMELENKKESNLFQVRFWMRRKPFD
jgi:hypothetical protein